MKITMLGNFRVDYTSETHHANSLEQLGHSVFRMQETQATADQVLASAMQSDLFVWIHTHGWQTPGTISMVNVLRLLKANKIPTMSYHLDLWLGIERQKDLDNDPIYREIEYFFATDKLMCDWFNDNTSVKGRFMPAGVYHKECELVELGSAGAAWGNEVIFVGSKNYHPEWSYRPKLVNWLHETYKSKFTHIGGDGVGVVRGLDLNQVYQSSFVAVGDTLCIDFKYPYYFSDRLFESTGRGGFTIFPYIKGLEDYFVIDKEIIVYEFGNFTELKEKIDYYIEHHDERNTIRKAGLERTKKDHTYLNRWQEILKEIYGTVENS